MKSTFLLFVLVISFILGALSLSAQTNGYKLAYFETGKLFEENDLLVKRFNYLLIQIGNQYLDVNNEESICNVTYKLKTVIEESGLKLSMEKVMEGAIQVKCKSYATYCAYYQTLFQKGYKHDEIISNLKLLWK